MKNEYLDSTPVTAPIMVQSPRETRTTVRATYSTTADLQPETIAHDLAVHFIGAMILDSAVITQTVIVRVGPTKVSR